MSLVQMFLQARKDALLGVLGCHRKSLLLYPSPDNIWICWGLRRRSAGDPTQPTICDYAIYANVEQFGDSVETIHLLRHVSRGRCKLSVGKLTVHGLTARPRA